MCRHAEDRKWVDSQGKNRCRECHRLNVRHLRLRDAQGRPRVERWRLNSKAFSHLVPYGKRLVSFELAGINRTSFGQYYGGCALQDPSRRTLLSVVTGIPEDRLWIKEER